MRDIKILYIDNKKDSKTVLNYLLEWEYDVRYVDSVYEAKTLALSEEYDLIITEIELKDGSGLDFAEEMKKKSDIKLIILSANKDPEQLLKAIEINVFKYLTKPVEPGILKSSIEAYINQRVEDEKKQINEETLELGEGFIYNIELNHLLPMDESSCILLTKQELNLIKTLAQRKGVYCEHSLLQSAIGTADEPASMDTLRTVVKKIRKKTYEGIIENFSGIGYKLNVKSSREKSNIFDIDADKFIDKKVLIVKGNEKLNTNLRIRLERYGLKCEQAFMLDEAKEALKYENYDYIILDLQLPDGNGIELIRDRQDVKSNKLIVLSNSEDMHYKEYLYFKGIIDYIENADDINYLAYSIYQTILKIESNQVYNNILLVENSKKITEQIKDILLPRNYNIVTVSSANKVFDLINHKSFNLIILDLELEGINSLEFLLSLKQHVDRALPIIMLSGEQRSYGVVRECYNNGAVECLRKPIFAEEFILKVDQWSDYYKQTLEIIDNHRILDAYKTIVDHTVIVSKTDKNGVITYANDMFCKVSGYSRDELIGKAHNIVRHPGMKESVYIEMWDTIKNQKKIWHGIIKNRKKDGSSYIVSTYIMPILDYNDEILEYIALRNVVSNSKR